MDPCFRPGGRVGVETGGGMDDEGDAVSVNSPGLGCLLRIRGKGSHGIAARLIAGEGRLGGVDGCALTGTVGRGRLNSAAYRRTTMCITCTALVTPRCACAASPDKSGGLVLDMHFASMRAVMIDT